MIAVDDLIGLGLSLAYVLAVLGASALLARFGASAEATRKLVHIGLGGWWVVASAWFTSAWWAAALPAVFVVVNAYAYRSQALSFMAREEGEDTPGTVYYAVSLTLLALFSFGIGAPYVGALGVFCMAFGDGFAAVLGKRFGRRAVRPAGGGKTLVGSSVMFAASFLSCAGVLLVVGAAGWEGAASAFALGAGVAVLVLVLLASLALAAVATALELLSPAGLDNLTVPLGVSALYAVLFLPAAWYTPALVGLLLSGAVAVASLRLRLLTVPGALCAAAVGALAFGAGGWPLWILLMWFFGSSNIASKLMARRAGRLGRKVRDAGTPTPAQRTHAQPRRLRQVLANGVPFLACALAYQATGNPWLLVVSAGALAASTADTWASEIGVHSTKPPVDIVTRKPLQAGLSGGVSPLGIGATVAGAAATALLALLLFRAFGMPVPAGPGAFALIVGCGVAGSIVDSVLGSLLQAKYRPPHATLLVESSPEGAASGYVLVSGYAWVTNDAVNLLSGIAVAALGALVAL